MKDRKYDRNMIHSKNISLDDECLKKMEPFVNNKYKVKKLSNAEKEEKKVKEMKKQISIDDGWVDN